MVRAVFGVLIGLGYSFIVFVFLCVFSPFEQFEVISVVSLYYSIFSVTNLSYWVLLSFILFVFLVVPFVRFSLFGVRLFQVLLGLYSLLLGVCREVLGRSLTGSYFVPLFVFFIFICFSNFFGLIPYAYTVTAQLAVTFFFGLSVWLGKLFVGVSLHGSLLWSILVPSGLPFFLVPFFVLVESIGFIIPVVSLSVRLFANMMSGHVLLNVLFGFTWLLLGSGSVLFISVGVISLLVLVLLLGLEVAVAFIQAYVFTLLSGLYLSDMEIGSH